MTESAEGRCGRSVVDGAESSVRVGSIAPRDARRRENRFTCCMPMCYSIIEMLPLGSKARTTGLCVALTLAALGSGVSCTAIAADSPRSGTSIPEIALQQVHMVETRDGATVWEVRADRVEVSERGGMTVLSRVTRPIEITFFSNRGRVTCVADRALLDMKTKDVELSGAVFARSDQGMELKTEGLKWIAASRRLQSSQAVTITRGTLVSQGKGMEAEADLERVRLFQNITSQFGSAPAATGRSRPR